jgi:hypothetical protein
MQSLVDWQDCCMELACSSWDSEVEPVNCMIGELGAAEGAADEAAAMIAEGPADRRAKRESPSVCRASRIGLAAASKEKASTIGSVVEFIVINVVDLFESERQKETNQGKGWPVRWTVYTDLFLMADLPQCKLEIGIYTCLSESPSAEIIQRA